MEAVVALGSLAVPIVVEGLGLSDVVLPAFLDSLAGVADIAPEVTVLGGAAYSMFKTPERPSTPPPDISPAKRQKLIQDANKNEYDTEMPYPQSMPGNWNARSKIELRKRYRRFVRRYNSFRTPARTTTALTRVSRRYPLQRTIRFTSPEIKFADGTSSGTISATSWAYATLMALQQGTNASQRIGNKIYAKGIQLMVQMYVSTPQTAPVFGNTCRMIAYHNKEANGALPGASPSIFLTDSFMSLRNSATYPKFDVLKDEVHNFMPTSSNGNTGTPTPITASAPHILRWYIPINRVIQYQSNAGTISDLLKDDYGVGIICNAGTSCSFDMRYKLLFSDA